jgi:hypothetical protein
MQGNVNGIPPVRSPRRAGHEPRAGTSFDDIVRVHIEDEYGGKI